MSVIPFIVVALFAQASQDAPIGARAAAEKADAQMQRFADCMVRRDDLTSKIARFLRSDGKKLGFEVPASCLGYARATKMLRFTPFVMRNALFEALYRRDFEAASIDVTNTKPLVLEAEFDGDVPPQIRPFRIIGDCVVRAAPAEARALALSSADTDAGREALADVVPFLAPCIPAGGEIGFSPVVLRGMTSEALYKLSLGANASVSSTN